MFGGCVALYINTFDNGPEHPPNQITIGGILEAVPQGNQGATLFLLVVMWIEQKCTLNNYKVNT